ncbi:thiol reductase thioredoxin [Polaribacter sejongensis]|uniref:Thiol reductase thioredoxin n=1 Tax=Polaribacter sejongensis TaxID=985043 RepID=A0ABM6PWQ2_9FLAO|nr:thioredoxin family protein [Polaribacter sejongensis]AUC21210.1 thiol reductase thioredoxin [Polaribacter sejongensis]
MKKVFLLACIMVFASCISQQKVTETQKVLAVKNQSGDLIGVANKASFQQIPYSTWFNQKLERYTPDPATITALKSELKGITIKGFMGTWCGDSKRETPHLYKILEQTDFNLNNFELITVDVSKKTPDNLQEGFDIKRVPTFIFYRDGKEIGRYVEYARESLEKDILKIVSGEPYKHSYDN